MVINHSPLLIFLFNYTEFFAKHFSYIADELEAAAELMKKNNYGKYLKKVLNNKNHR